MKLEIKYLAPYLPYGLKAKNCFNELAGIKGFQYGNDSVNNELYIFVKNKMYLTGYLYQCKPILFPLSQFVKFTFSEEVEECLLNYSADFILNQTNRLPYFIIQEFLSNKIDVFGLIEAGLAEPVTEDFNPYK